jgi:hypothetical protein
MAYDGGVIRLKKGDVLDVKREAHRRDEPK